MVTSLGQVVLRDSTPMAIYRVEPPQPDYAAALCHFLEHKRDTAFRMIRQRLSGKYVNECVDRYFVGEVEGQIVGQVWYGLPRGGTGVGNFGHTYTEPEHRGKGIATHLVRALVEDFAQSEGRCLLCSAGPDAARIYQRFGFQFIDAGAQSGGMALLRAGVAPSFQELDADYFRPGRKVGVREGSIRHRHDCDRLLFFSPSRRAAGIPWHRAFITAHVSTFEEALFHVEDGRGHLTVLETCTGSIVGYAYALNLGSPWESPLRVLDFLLHPHYLADGSRLVRETASRAAKDSAGGVYAFCPTSDQEKLSVLQQADFEEAYRFPSGFRTSRGPCDLLMLRYGA